MYYLYMCFEEELLMNKLMYIFDVPHILCIINIYYTQKYKNVTSHPTTPTSPTPPNPPLNPPLLITFPLPLTHHVPIPPYHSKSLN